MRQWLRWLPFLILFIQVTLYATGVLTLQQAAILLLTLEGLLAVVVVGEFTLLLRAYRKAHRSGAGRGEAFGAALEAVLPRPVAYLVRQEFRVFGAVYGALRRKRAVAPDDRVFTYSGHLRGLLIVMILVSIVELAVVEFFVPWNWLRWTLLILGAYGLLWVAGFASSAYTRPHSVGTDRLHVRFAIFTHVSVPLGNVTSVSESLCGTHQKLVEVSDGSLAVSVLGTSNVSVRLDPPVEVDLGRSGRHTITALRFYADDPALATATVRAAIAGADASVT